MPSSTKCCENVEQWRPHTDHRDISRCHGFEERLENSKCIPSDPATLLVELYLKDISAEFTRRNILKCDSKKAKKNKKKQDKLKFHTSIYRRTGK